MERGGFTYIITNKSNSVLYTGVTSDLKNRIWQHKLKVNPLSFSSRYNAVKLVYFQPFTTIDEAIAFEKYVKGKSRQFKIDLIQDFNPKWKDLFDEV